jgi:hypothetical protein
MLDFLALATFLSWPLQILVYSGHAPAGTATLFLVLAGCGPSLAAVLLSRGRVLRALVAAPPLGWLAVALVGPSLLVLLAALAAAAREAIDPYEREHVTPFLYRHPERFGLANLERDPPLGDLRWTVDTPEDFAFVQKVYAALYPANPAFTSADVLEVTKREAPRGREG